MTCVTFATKIAERLISHVCGALRDSACCSATQRAQASAVSGVKLGALQRCKLCAEIMCASGVMDERWCCKQGIMSGFFLCFWNLVGILSCWKLNLWTTQYASDSRRFFLFFYFFETNKGDTRRFSYLLERQLIL
jgi:hypothetical protein